MTGVEDVKPGSLKAWMAFTRPKTWGVAVAPVIAALSLALFETGRFDALTAFFTMTIDPKMVPRQVSHIPERQAVLSRRPKIPP